MLASIVRYNGAVLEYKKVHRLLGMMFDSLKLTFKNPIEHVYTKCIRRYSIINIYTLLIGVHRGRSLRYSTMLILEVKLIRELSSITVHPILF